MPLPANSMLGPYRIVEIIGEGGMGAVYRAQDTRLGRDVAVKILTALTLSDKERLTRFAQEARTTGMLNHPNLLTVYDVGNSRGTPFLVSELLQGETLRERVGRGPMPPRKAIEIATQMAQGLAAAHEKGVVHRDLKPENIFLTRDGRVKILDFGIAKLTAKSGGEGGVLPVNATEPGIVMGTVGYMAPEQVRGEVVDQRADIFAFGTIVYEMLTGAGAFKRNTSIETLSAILKEDPPDLLDIVANIPPALERLVRRCLEKDRELRFQTARDLAFNLETLAAMPPSASLPIAQAHPAETRTPQAPRPGTSQADVPTMRHARTDANTLIRETPQPLPRRPTLSRPAPPPRRVSPLLLGLLFVVAVAGAAWGGWFAAQRMRKDGGEPAYRRITFRRGEVRSARFSPDGETIVYSAAWDGRPPEIFIGNRQSPDARPIGIVDAEVVAVSRSTELAVLLHRDRLTNLGTLARVPMAGGAPRPVADGVAAADWSPDGSSLAILRVDRGKYRIEYPAGTLRYETPHQIRDLRVSPDGRQVAFIEMHGGEYDIAVVGDGSPAALARGWRRGVNGLAWRPDGREIWITGSDSSAPPALYAITTDGEVRFVDRLTGAMKLFDVAASGNALLTNAVWRAALMWGTPGDTVERETAWFDWSMLADLSPDGRRILFNETREGGGARSSIYLRTAGEPVPVKIGEGYGDALSPDGHWVLAHNGPKLTVVPTGTGDAREVKVPGAFDNGAVWLSDSRRVIVGGAVPGRGYQLWLIDTLEDSARPVTPENIWGESIRPFAVTSDSKTVAGMTEQQTIALYPLDGGGQPVPVAGAERGEVPIQFSADGLALYVYRPNALPQQVVRIDLATGARSLWKDFVPNDPAGVYKIAPVVMTPDATGYAYNALRILSELYVAEGLAGAAPAK